MEFQAEILRFLQAAANPVLDMLAVGVTFFGELSFVVPVVAFFYWCVDKEQGLWLCWCAGFTNLFSHAIKGFLKIERPIGKPGIRSIFTESATGYSFPSGHATNSAALLSGFARSKGGKRLWTAAVILPLLVSLSRLYLGCHWPMDVLGGYLIGLLMPLLLYPLFCRYKDRAYLLFFFGTVLFLPLFGLLGEDALDFWKLLGFNFGCVFGSFLEEKFVRFSVEGTKKQKVLRFFLGFLFLGAFYLLMKLFFPSTIPFTFLRYFVVSVRALAVWPWLFQKIGL